MKDGYRHEYKYLVSGASSRLLKSRLRCFMSPDPYVGPQGQYTIRSLYFDDPFAAAYEEKMSGIRERVKYRIRTIITAPRHFAWNGRRKTEI